VTARRLAFLAAAAGLVLQPGCGRSQAPDLVIVTLDTVRADRLGCYGHAGGLTPNIDKLAARAVLFEDASSAVPITLPSHATLFTGRYPSATGVRNNGTFVVPESETTLAERLRDRGWKTGAVVAAYPLQSRYGLSQGFEIYDEELPPRRPGRGQAFSVHFNERDARTVTDRALEVWKRLAGRRRFLWVHYFDAHAPYAAPEPYGSAHADAPYDGEIAYVDVEVGRLLDALARESPKAWIVVTADHGESLGEHGEKTHGVFLYESTLRVPLIVRAPDRWPEGRRVSPPVTLADVVPTILALAGLPPASGLDGADLAPLLEGKHLGREVYAESYLPRLQFRFAPLTMIRDGRLKYIDAPAAELYDLGTDPAETRNLATERPETPELAARLAEVTARADPEASDRAAGALDPDAEARLRSLGYASAGSLRPSGERGRDPKAMTGYLQRYDRAVGSVSAGRLEEGIAELRALVPEAPENYMARYQLAAGLLSAGRPGEAREQLEQVVSAAPEFGNATLMLAECLATLGLLDEAVARFEEAARRMPTQAEPKLAEGRALEDRGRFEPAAGAYRAAIEREPNAPEPPRALIALRAGRGDLAKAIDELRALADRFPASAALPAALADAAYRADDTATAEAAMRRSLAIDPTRSDARVLEARLMLDAGKIADATAAYRAVLRASPGLRPAEIGLARALAMGPPDPDTDRWLNDLATKYPKDPAPPALLGLSLERRGDAAGAAAAYRAALVLDPRDVDAREGLRRLGAER